MIKEIALLSPIYVTFFWGIVFLVQRGTPSKPKLTLGVFMAMVCLLYCSHAVFFSELYQLYSYIESIYIFTMLSVYPLYFIYILQLTTRDVKSRLLLPHFAPAIIFSLLSIITTLMLTNDDRIFYVQHTLIEKNLRGLTWTTMIGIKGHFFFISRLIFLVQVVYYVFTAIKLANKHNKRVANYFSDIEGITLNWVRDLSWVIFFVAIASITFAIIGRSYFTRHDVSLLIPSIIFSVVLFEIGFKANQQVQIKEKIIEPEKHHDVKYDAPKEHDGELKTRLIQLFENDKIYKQADLRITTISEMLGTNRTYISKLINDEFGMNFNEFVNQYRIGESKKLLTGKDRSLFTLEYIAEESGFGSVNSFTRAFKKAEGTTPGRYRETMKKEAFA